LHKVIVNAGALAPGIITSYSETNKSNDDVLASDLDIALGQSFTGTGKILTSVKFYIRNGAIGHATGNVVSKIYAHSGTYGTSSVPTGSALATSDNVDASALTDVYSLIEFPFSGANRISLTDSVPFVATIEYSNTAFAVGSILVGDDASSPTYNGNMSHNNGTWAAYSGRDMVFYLYGISGSATIYDSDGVDNINTIGTIDLSTVVPGSTFDYDVPLKHGLDIYPDTACDLTAIFSY
jgi:hypothetical protein